MLAVHLLPPLSLPCDGGPCGTVQAPWSHAGPAGYHGLDKTPDDPTGILSAGAAQAIVGDLRGSWYLGSVNGGVWRSANLSKVTPHWVPVTDVKTVPCASISALAASPTLVIAGCGGSTSSEMGNDWNSLNVGDWGGIMQTTDGGATWLRMDAFPTNYYVSAIAIDLAHDRILVAARSHFYDRDAGGIWRSDDLGHSFTRVLSQPVFNLVVDPNDPSNVLAALPFPTSADSAVLLSTDGGRSFTTSLGSGLTYKPGHAPFYPCLALSGTHLYYGALTVSAADATQTNSVIFRTPWPLQGGAGWAAVPGGPKSEHGLDDDAMPKDRMALLPHPNDPGMLFVAGNGDQIAYRVTLREANSSPGAKGGLPAARKLYASWAAMVGSDVVNGASPHCDCRNFGWDPATNSLLLVSDGGIFRRTQPERPGGKWLSANGDVGAMEFLSAGWDRHANRWVAGAQDNDVQVAPPNVSATDVAAGIVLGDGMQTAVDDSVSPSRLWGTRQFLGSRRGELRRRRLERRATSDPRADSVESREGVEDSLPGFCFTRGDAWNTTNRVCLDTASWGFTSEAFPFFYHPFALNALAPSTLVTWARATAGQPAGFWQLEVPPHASCATDVPNPTFVGSSDGGDVYELRVGGATGGRSDPSLLVALNDTHLFYRSGVATGGQLEARPLPVAFAQPLILKYDAQTHAPIIGPVSHGKTVSLAVSRADSATLAVTGRPDVLTNRGSESVWLSRDAGQTWLNATGNLRAATQTVGQPRPSTLALIDLQIEDEREGTAATALLVGTVSGVYLSWTDPARLGKWARLGSCADLPLVLTLGLSHEPHSDTLVAATFGRGVYVMRGATAALRRARAMQDRAACDI